MNRLFGAPKQQPPAQNQPHVSKMPPSNEKASLAPEKQYDLSEQSKRMESKIRELSDTVSAVDKELADLYKKAKSSKGVTAQTYKQRCVMLMKKKKMYQQQIDSYLSQQLNLDSLAFTKENIQNNLETASAMKQAVTTQKNMMQGMNIDDIDDLKDDMEEMMYETNQIQETLNRNYDLDIDEADLDAEMKELDDDLFKEALQNPQANQAPNYFASSIHNKEANVNKI